MRIVVVGGGVLGASVAYHLARRGAAVHVVDRDDPTRATSAGAGIVCPWLHLEYDDGYLALATAAAAHYGELIPALQAAGQAELGYRRVGGLVLAHEPALLERLAAVGRERAATAPEIGQVEILIPDEAGQLFPPLSPEFGAVLVPGGARLDGRLLAQGLRRAAEALGAGWQAGDAALLVERGRARGVLVAGGRIEADAVVVAAGAWAPALLQPHGVHLPVRPQKGQIIHLRLEGRATGGWPMLLPTDTDHYLLTFDDSRVVVGATRETGSGFDDRVTAGGLKEVLDQGLRIAPGLRHAGLIETRIGFRPMSPTGNPLLDAAPGVERLFIGNGLGPRGLTVGAYSGRLLAEFVLSGQKPALMRPFGLDGLPHPKDQ